MSLLLKREQRNGVNDSIHKANQFLKSEKLCELSLLIKGINFCVCVHVWCEFVCVCFRYVQKSACGEDWVSLRCWSSLPSGWIYFILFVSAMYTGKLTLDLPGNLHFLIQCRAVGIIDRCYHVSDFVWVRGIWTWSLKLSWKVIYPLSQLLFSHQGNN